MSTSCSPSAPALLQALGHSQSDRRLEVLRGVAEHGSISQAARQVGVSYKAAWQAIDTLTNLAGTALVTKSVGGAGGGGARITAAGLDLLQAAEAMAQARGVVMQQLQAPAAVHHLGMQTSMRNQWPCWVQQVEVSGPLAVVHLHSQYADLTLAARLTAESAQLLGLQNQQPVLAMCKATAVQVSAADALAANIDSLALNTWPGTVTRVTAGDVADEVAVNTAAGVQLVGFAQSHSGLQAGHAVDVHVPQAAVVLALMPA